MIFGILAREFSVHPDSPIGFIPPCCGGETGARDLGERVEEETVDYEDCVVDGEQNRCTSGEEGVAQIMFSENFEEPHFDS